VQLAKIGHALIVPIYAGASETTHGYGICGNHFLQLAGISVCDVESDSENEQFDNELPSRKTFPPWRWIGVIFGAATFAWGRWYLLCKRITTEGTAVLAIISVVSGGIVALWSVCV
jgi:hypothetical protein